MPKSPPKSPLGKSLSKAGVKINQKRKEPLWKGPEIDGITYSLLCRFLNCRERFRLLVVEGLRPAPTFNARMEYGSMWHVCEEALSKQVGGHNPLEVAHTALLVYCQELCQKFQSQQPQVEHWYQVCKTQFPFYVDYWKKHTDVKDRTPLLQEETFNIPYKLPSGRVVRLRGKMDAVDLIGKKTRLPGIYLQENKTKSEIKPDALQRQLSFDLQTMMYVVALQALLRYVDTGIPMEVDHSYVLPEAEHLGNIADVVNQKTIKVHPLMGVRYNVIRRPLSGGKGSIVRLKPTKKNPQGESKEAYYKRLADIIAGDTPSYFARWKVELTAVDIERFKRETLNPILEQLCDWWGFIEAARLGEALPFTGVSISGITVDNHIHWRHPFGVYNVLDEGGSTDLDEYLTNGSQVGLTRSDDLFSELR